MKLINIVLSTINQMTLRNVKGDTSAVKNPERINTPQL